MLFTGCVIDQITGQALVKATISLDNVAMAATDANGCFNFETASDNYHEMEVSFVEYQTATLPADQSFNETGQIQLTPAPQNLPGVTVTAKKPAAANYLPYVVGGVGLLALASTGKKKIMGKIDPMYLVLGGVALVGVYLLTKKTTPAPPVYTPLPVQQPNPVAQDITAAAPVLSSLTNLFEAI